MIPRAATIVLLWFLTFLCPVYLWSTEPKTGDSITEGGFLDFGVTLSVKDIEASVEFYRDDLGFSLVHYVVGSADYVSELSPADGRPYGAKLSIGEHEIHLHLVGDDDQVRPSGARYSVRIAEPAKYYQRLVDRDLEINVLIRTQTGEPYWFTLRDPDGHSFIFMGPIRKPRGESQEG